MLTTLLLATVLGASPEADMNRQVLAKALAYVDGKGAELEKGASCVNCHHAPLRAWAFGEAAKAGAEVDAKALKEATSTQIAKVIELKDDYRDKQWGHSLSAFYVVSSDDDLPADAGDSLAKILIAEQSADGSWKAAGQFNGQRRPKKDAGEAQTLWNTLALARLEPREGTVAAREKAQVWLNGTEPGATIDVRSLRLIAERKWGSMESAAELQTMLIMSQRDDGGWGWQADDASDAWGTGLALYALSGMDDKAALTAIEKARAFLAKTQTENGSWHVEGKLTKNADMASYFGTNWAIIGLSKTQPR